MANTDRIEKQVVLRAPRARVFRALTDSREFGAWFQARFEGPFIAGATIQGQITHPGYEHMRFKLYVERVEPERYFSFRWHPYAVDPKVDYSQEEPTLVEFFLDEAKEGVHLRIVESGFDRIPAARRAEAFRMNDQGWSAQAANIERHVAG